MDGNTQTFVGYTGALTCAAPDGSAVTLRFINGIAVADPPSPAEAPPPPEAARGAQ